MKKKKELLVVGILIGIFCVVGVSYAVWQVTHVQTGENSLTVGCFKVEFADLNPIQIGKAYPIEDNVGASLIPYEFTITNTCNDLASYQINLEVLNESTMNEHSYIKSMLNEENPNLLTNNQVVEKTLENASIAYKLKKGYLTANETKSFTLRLWLDKNTPPSEEIMNSVFKSKVTITTSYIDEAPLASGTLRTISEYEKKGIWQYKSSITKLIIEDELNPIEGAIGSFDESLNQDKSVMSYVVENSKENESDKTTYTAYLQSNEKLYLSSGDYLFSNFLKLESIEGMRYIDTSNVINMQYMFNGCGSLTSVNLESFNTSNVANMYSMFWHCSSLTTIDVSTFDTSNVINMHYMFGDCSSLTSIDVSNFNTANVTNMNYMFSNCSNLTDLDLSSLNTTNVTSMISMFYGCSSLTTLDVSSFNTINVTTMASMFERCSNLTNLDLSDFDTSSVTNMCCMFTRCSSLTSLDIANFNTSNVIDMGYMYMFDDCEKLTTITYGDHFIHANDVPVSFMFRNCPANKPTHESWTGIL